MHVTIQGFLGKLLPGSCCLRNETISRRFWVCPSAATATLSMVKGHLKHMGV
jgi:hypothetical protein